MRCITILQPWATLIALGEKKFETRSWKTKNRGQLAIHAGKKIDKEICQREPFKSVLAKHGYTADNLPTGSVVAVCRLKECYRVTRPYGENGLISLEGTHQLRTWGDYLSNEQLFGDYSDGRFAWELADVQRLPEPIPAKGRQGLWNWDGV
ncbi:ASCH domain-containing protein [Paenibacillus sophorae]|uniref:ASCH domain-containing protein n=1 Tax=Paenibacillus sophorae TaxID=1333845 RepID=A0A1H8R096_9BACL|nr:ASCH domain-containing protein [Paenibacillus sophorae]QWU14903.1 ASCH domain-containing protein [Paenibacillus sophorae]SEO60009.1 ASCH domain-containing protein [Paenibacillus sophorae]